MSQLRFGRWSVCPSFDSPLAPFMNIGEKHRSALRGCGFEQSTQSNQIVGSHGEHELEVHAGHASELGLIHRANPFRPAEAFLDALARAMTDGVSGMALWCGHRWPSRPGG